MVLGGISQFFPPSLSSVIVGAYVIVFGLGKSRPCAINIRRKLIVLQWSLVWSSSPTSRTTPTAMRRSCSLSWAAVSVSILPVLNAENGVRADFSSLHLRGLPSDPRCYSPRDCWLHRRYHWYCLLGPRVHSVDRASVEHARVGPGLGCGAGLNDMPASQCSHGRS